MNFEGLKKYNQHGTVLLNREDNPRAKTKEVPDLPGVYLFSEINGSNAHLKYIGSSGTMLQNGNFKGQMMRGRINNKMNSSQSRAQFFESHFRNSNCDQIKISWYVTYDESFLDLPKYVEAKLLQEYYNLFGRLPEWNTSF